VTGSQDSTVLIWAVGSSPAQAPVQVEPANLETLWEDLGSVEASRAFQALQRLTALPGQTVPLLQARLKPVRPDEAVIAQKIRDLESEQFTVRDQAEKELKALGPLVEAQVKTALETPVSAEAQKRLGAILESIEARLLTGDRLREARAVEALE